MTDSMDDGELLPDDVAPVPAPEATRPRRRVLALWGVLAVLALGAGALAIRSGDDDPPKLPVALGAAGGARSEAMGAPAAADMSMLAYVHYVAGDDLPLLGGDGPAYKLSGAVDEDRVRDLADALGLEGDVKKTEGGWVVDDGDGGHLEVYAGGGGSWWYTPDFVSEGGGVAGSTGSSTGSAGATEEDLKRREEEAAAVAASEEPTTTVAVAPAPDCPPDADCAYPEPEPFTPPADLPSKDEAQSIALDLFRSAGLDVDDAKVTVDGPYESWYVQVDPRVDGRLASGYAYTASIGSKGKITSAGGTLNAPERLGDYPVLDTRKAIDRLNTQYGGAERFAADDCIETSSNGDTVRCSSAGAAAPTDLLCATPTTLADPAATEDVPPPTKPLDDPDGSVSSGDPTVSSVPPECVPSEPPEPVEVVLHEAEEILVMVSAFDESGDAYLVPGYRMTGDDDHLVEVAAVDDDSLLPEPEPVAPAPQPADDPGATEPGTGRCAPVEPGPDGAVPDICLDPQSTPPAEPTEAPAPG